MTEFICGLRSAASVVYPVVKGEITKVAFRHAWAPENRTDDTFALPEIDVHGDVFRTDSILENISVLGECAGKTSSPLMCCQVWPVPVEAQPQLDVTSDALSHLGRGFRFDGCGSLAT